MSWIIEGSLQDVFPFPSARWLRGFVGLKPVFILISQLRDSHTIWVVKIHTPHPLVAQTSGLIFLQETFFF